MCQRVEDDVGCHMGLKPKAEGLSVLPHAKTRTPSLSCTPKIQPSLDSWLWHLTRLCGTIQWLPHPDPNLN